MLADFFTKYSTFTNEKSNPAIFALSLHPSFSQIVVSGININALDTIKVCSVKINGIEQILGNMDVSVDYGQIEKWSNKKFTDKKDR